MGIQWEGLVKEILEEFLNANTNVIAYNATEVPGVDPSTMVRHLNVKEDYKLVK